jgi:hypothetical protein
MSARDLSTFFFCIYIDLPLLSIYAKLSLFHKFYQPPRKKTFMLSSPLSLLKALLFLYCRYLWLTIDGMTAARTGVVQTEGPRQDKELQENRLPFTINGMLTSVKGLEYIAYVSSGAFPSDSDMTIHCIHSTILKIEEKQGFLPPNLYLQMDNTAKDMKNRHVTNYLAVLVRMGIFKEVLCV